MEKITSQGEIGSMENRFLMFFLFFNTLLARLQKTLFVVFYLAQILNKIRKLRAAKSGTKYPGAVAYIRYVADKCRFILTLFVRCPYRVTFISLRR